MRRRTAVHPDDVRWQLAVRGLNGGVGRRVDQRVHHRARGPGQPGLARYRQIRGIRSRVHAAGQFARLHRLRILAWRGNVHGDHGHRHRRAARDRDDPAPDGGKTAAEHAVRQVEVGELAGFRIEHAQPGLAGAVDHRDAAIGQQRVRPGAQLPHRSRELLFPRAQRERLR